MKETRLFIRVSKADKDLFLMGARKAKMTLTEFIRMAASFEAMKYARVKK